MHDTGKSQKHHLKGTAGHSDFTLPMGRTSYTDKRVMHTLVQRLEDAVIAKDVMEECATNNDLQDRLTLEKIKKRIEAKESAKRSMAH